MKYLSLLIILSIFGCKSQQITIEKPVSQQKTRQSKSFKILEKMEIIPNQTLQVVKDEAGQRYIKTLDGQNTLIKYTYKTTPLDTQIMDAGYTQYVWFEIPGHKIETKTYKTADLQKKPAYVQIHAFRNSRLIPVTKDSVSIKLIDENQIKVHFKINPQYQNIQQKDITQTIKL